ncbi:hypothetical protein SAMN04489859_101050 [Paracoccus alcaliphilus]|uniref:DUF3299 domain-containing protein n=1 Tax=Paracoccus alcaliphilus TaxID=34002 RepID=A0A1H8HQF8_9RHOB|nr:hypothetical protein [Paracoccus alcaliphilus]WCR19057.1 hypothetical protein JHW40_05030 [Paracoccus alcaliphilus]SEN58510.1 hypothetical protein SAMN04489859_101050 [Paracoccus alcaliphilus]
MDRRDFLAVAGASLAMPSLVRADGATVLRFADLYVRGRQLTDAAAALEGQAVQMTGYMAPPLKPEIDFFVLTRRPMSVCPFCETEAEWPIDIVLAFSEKPVEVVRYTDLIRVTGRFETGFDTDEETGFVSFLRLRDISYRRL